MNTSRRRVAPGGFVTFLVLGGVVVLAILAGLYFRQTYEQGRLSHRFFHGEVAHQLALSGVNAAVSELRVLHPAGGGDAEILREGTPRQIEGRTVTFSSLAPQGPLAHLVRTYDPSDNAKIAVQVTFRRFASLYPEGSRTASGMATDPAEKGGLVKIVSTGSFGGIEKVVVCYKAVKVVRPLAPLLPRFTLFVKNPPSAPDGLNLLDYERKRTFPSPVGRVHPTATHDALVLINRPEAHLPGTLTTFSLDRTGWVFLGGASSPESRWLLNLTYGSGSDEPYAEGLQLPRKAAYVVLDPLTKGVLAPASQEILDGTFDRLLMKTGVYSKVKTDSRLFSRFGFEQDPVRCSSLHLFGTTEIPSPTIVLGKVFRRYLFHSYLTNKSRSNAFALPYAHTPGMTTLDPLLSAFDFRPMPEGLAPFDRRTIVNGVFGNDPGRYGKFMSNAIVEPVARSVDHIERNLAQEPGADSFDPLYQLVNVGRITRHLEPLDPDPGKKRTFLYDTDTNSRVRILDRPNPALFEGDLNGFTTGDLLIPKRVTFVFKASDFKRWTDDGKLQVQGLMYQHPDQPDLVIDRPLEIEEGGVLVARDNIEVRAPIRLSPGATLPLTLVALTGKIIIQTDKVHAFLVALGQNGSVERRSEGNLEIVGGIATTHLALSSLTKGVTSTLKVTKSLRWDPRGDPIGTGRTARRVYFDTHRVTLLP